MPPLSTHIPLPNGNDSSISAIAWQLSVGPIKYQPRCRSGVRAPMPRSETKNLFLKIGVKLYAPGKLLPPVGRSLGCRLRASLSAQIQLPRDGGYLEAKTSANSLQSFHELRGVFNGEAVVREASGTGSQSIALYTKFPLDQINWVPAQFSSQHRVWHIWPGFMAAHTSPIYIQVDKNELFSSSEAMYMHTLLDGGLTWPDTLSIPADSSGQVKVSNVKMAQKSCTTDNITILNIV